ncbi:RraA family protein [Legionella brunensis]|uniref:Putative 4-hydroxy-4-methyl-2-oxoglutarate aldolase n=1 Tax=Legionella brunensis TaxID=29422 RepID=A0A0W0SEE3_9GAMM|nr:RraA family protein [Legionella brunensis]KTC81529.1 DlpA protein (isocitrate and isopropylmalate dehydrogenase family protein) [Legionella brunensis]
MNLNEIADKLALLSTTHFCDASASIRIFDSAIGNLSNQARLVGKAFPIEANGDLLSIMQAIELANPGDVLVIASNGAQKALAGEILATAALKKGIAGMVMDGYCRDVDAIRALDFPFYAKGIYPAAATKHKLSPLNVPIVCGNIAIHPQDIIFGDDSGLIAMSYAELIMLLPVASEIKAKEVKALDKIQQGMALGDIFNLQEYVDELRQQKSGCLKWL